MKKVIVADIMTRNPIVASPEINLLDCAKVMVKKRTGSILLVDGKRLVGIISTRDILWAIIKKSPEDLKNIQAIDISPKKIATISPSKSLEYAIKKVKKVRYSRLPVVHHGELVGIITLKDIFNYNPDLFPEMKEYHKIREWDEKIKRIESSKKRKFVEGICEECGNVDLLEHYNGMLICDSCKNS